jgi:chromosomal replication initiator protein
MRDNLEIKFQKLILEAVQKENPSITSIQFKIDQNIDTPSNQHVIDCMKFYKESTTKSSKNTANTDSFDQPMGTSKSVNERYTLVNFIVGSDNQLAYSACEAVARNPGKSYNPLYIYGDV